jgi:hypothetical protein
VRRREPRSLERDHVIGALARQERGPVRHHLAAPLQHRRAHIGPRHRIADLVCQTLLGGFELDAVVRRPVAELAGAPPRL